MCRLGLSVAGPFGRRCLNSLTVPRFHSPLIEPDGRISRIRLSDKDSRFRPRETPRPRTQVDQSQHTVQVLAGEPCLPPAFHLVLPTQPLTEPEATVPVDGTVHRRHRAEAKVVRPAQQQPVQSDHPVLDTRPLPTTVGQLADRVPEGRHLLRRRPSPDVGPPRPRRVAPPDRVYSTRPTVAHFQTSGTCESSAFPSRPCVL